MRYFVHILNGMVSSIVVTPTMAQKLIDKGLVIIEVTDMSPRPTSGWTYDGTNFFPPADPPAKTTVISLALWDAFTEAEQESLVNHANAKVKRFLYELRLRDTLNLTKVGLVLAALEAAGILAAGRAAEIIGGL